MGQISKCIKVHHSSGCMTPPYLPPAADSELVSFPICPCGLHLHDILYMHSVRKQAKGHCKRAGRESLKQEELHSVVETFFFFISFLCLKWFFVEIKLHKMSVWPKVRKNNCILEKKIQYTYLYLFYTFLMALGEFSLRRAFAFAIISPQTVTLRQRWL